MALTNDGGFWVNEAATGQWIIPSQSSITVTGTTTDNVWGAWCNQGMLTNTSTSVFVWNHWNQNVVVRKETRLQEAQRRLREAEAAAARAQQQAVAQAAYAVKQAEEAQARERAKKLLIENLTPEQARTLAEHRYFDVQVGAKTYRIHQGTHGNVKLVEAGVEKVSYCIQPADVPTEDSMLAQKLFLQFKEEEFLKVANATRVGARQPAW